MIKNQSGQVVNNEMIDLLGAAFTGAVTVYVTIDNGTQAIGSVGGGAATLKGNGLYQYLPSQAETNGDSIEFTFVGVGAAPSSKTIATLTLAQSQALQTATGPGVITGRDLVTDAMLWINAIDAVEVPSAEEAAFVLRALNRILDNWNADRAAVYADAFNTYTLTPALSPHTIGPSGTWVVTSRPVSVEGAVLVFNTTNNPQVGITLRDASWYRSLLAPSVSTSTPTDLYYEPDWPNGKLFFWPVPSTAYQVTLWTRVLLARLGLNDAFTCRPTLASSPVRPRRSRALRPANARSTGISKRSARSAPRTRWRCTPRRGFRRGTPRPPRISARGRRSRSIAARS
jgi:hypothetical protein